MIVFFQGDSGGPLTVRQSSGQHVLVGDISRGFCGFLNDETSDEEERRTGIFARISHLRQWIDHVMSEAEFCGGTSDADNRRKKRKKIQRRKDKRRQG